MPMSKEHKQGSICILMSTALLGALSLDAHAESFVAPTNGTLYVKCVGGRAGAVSQFGTGSSMLTFVPILNSLPQTCPTTEVPAGHVSAGQKVPFGIHTVWEGQDYWAFSTGADQASAIAFSDVYDSLKMNGRMIQQTGANTWVMHLDDAAHYIVDFVKANNLLIEVRLAADESGPAQTSAVTNAAINGRWSATVADTKATTHVDIELRQNSDGRVIGDYMSSQGGTGKVTGVVAGTDFTFELTQTVESCPGTFKGKGVLEGDRIVGSYTGSDCLGDRGIGTVTMVRKSEITYSTKSAVATTEVEPARLPPPDGHFSVKAVAYRVIPHERTSYYTIAGHSNTSCYGNGTYFGNSVSGTVDCSTVTTPPQYRSMTIRSIEVYNQVEAGGMIYTIRCSANWFGSNCSWLTPGDTFSAEIKGRDMWISARKGGNLGKAIHAKYQMLDRRPRT
jgi:hypothetical protein